MKNNTDEIWKIVANLYIWVLCLKLPWSRNVRERWPVFDHTISFTDMWKCSINISENLSNIDESGWKTFRMTNRVYTFCQMTSVKGIPRLLKAKSSFMRFIWTISVIVFLSIALMQAVILTIDYRQYKTYTSTGETFMGFFEENMDALSTPDITLCNANIFASERRPSRDFPTIIEYFRLAEGATACGDNCTDEEAVAMNHIRGEILTTGGYFDYIGHKNAKQLGHSRESFLTYCALDVEGVVYGRHIPCFPTAHIIDIQDPTFFNCYTIRLPQDKFPDTMYTGFRVVLHLDDYAAVRHEQSVLTPHEDLGQLTGVWVFVHERNTPLRGYENRLLLQPGHFHDIPVKVALRTYLPRPHGQCLDIDQEEYDLDLCYIKCFQARIYERCGCLYMQNSPSQQEAVDRNGTACLSLSLENRNLIKNWKCALEEKMKGFVECEKSCPKRCKEVRYTIRVRQC